MHAKKMKLLLSVFAFFIMVAVTLFVTPRQEVLAVGQTYYVSFSTGNDTTNNGTSPSTPWKTLTRASQQTYLAGDQILLKSGDTWDNETFYPKGTGTAVNPILISSYGTGNRPLIRPGMAGGTNAVYGIKIINTAGYKITNLEFTTGYNGISLWLDDSINNDYLWIENCYFHDMTMPDAEVVHIDGTGQTILAYPDLAYAVGVVVGFRDTTGGNTMMNNITITNSTFNYVDAGVRIEPKSGSGSLLRQDLTLLTQSQIRNFNITNSTFYRNYRSGSIMLYFVTGGQIADIIVDQTGYLKGMWYGTAGVQIDHSRNYTVTRAEIKNTLRSNGSPDGAGFDFEAANNNITLSNSNIHDNAGNAFMVYGANQFYPGPNADLIIENNIFRNNNASNYLANQAYWVKQGQGNTGIIRNNQVYLLNNNQQFNNFTDLTFDKTNQVFDISGTLVFPRNLAAGKSLTSSTTLINPGLATDGLKNNTLSYTELGTTGPQWIQVDLGERYDLTEIDLWHVFVDGRAYHDVIVQVSNDATFGIQTTVFNNDTNNSIGQGMGNDAEYAESSAGKIITFAPVNARYIRMWSNGSTANASSHYVEVEAYATQTSIINQAGGKSITSSSGNVINPIFTTDGLKNNALNLTDVGANGAQWIQIDLGGNRDLTKVNLWHYYGDGRTYRDVIVQVSSDATFATKTTVFNNDANNSAGQGAGIDAEYAETSAGKSISFNAVNARYIRLWTNGSSVNAQNHYVEVEVYASINKSNLALDKSLTSSASLTNAIFTTDGYLDNNANYTNVGAIGAQWIQIDLGVSNDLTQVKLWHYFADGRTYRDVIVQLSNDATFATKTTVFNNDADNSAGQGIGSDAEYAESSMGKNITFSAINARYVRLWTNGSSLNTGNQYMEVEVYSSINPTNRTLGKSLSSSSSNLISPALTTDGLKNNTLNYTDVGSNGAQWIQIDLGAVYNLSKVNLWHYFGDGRTYRDVIVQLSTNATFGTKTTVYNNDTNNSAGQGTGSNAEYVETSGGKSITFDSVAARYIRLWTNGSNINANNHYVEVEAFQ